MEVMEYDFFPKNSNQIINNIFLNVVDFMRPTGEASVYHDLKDKYEREKKLIKTDNKIINFANKTYNGVKRFNNRHFRKSRIYQKLERLDLVEKLYSESEYKINNFEWKVLVLESDSYEQKELLANSLESFDQFKDAIKAGVIKVDNTIKIHNEITHETDGFNEILLYKLRNNIIDYFKNDLEIELMSDEEITENLLNYQAVQEGINPFYDDFDDDEIFDNSNIYNYMLNEYMDELKAIAFRLFVVYQYFVDNGIDIENLNDDSYQILHRAIHYYNLEDGFGFFKKDDDYATEYDSLSIFYKNFIYSLAITLYSSIDNNNDKLPESSEETKEEPKVIDKSREKNFDDLTHKLVLEIKKRKSE